MTQAGTFLDLGCEWQDLVQTCKPSKCSLQGHVLMRNTGPVTVPPSQLAIYLSDTGTLDGSARLLRPYKIKKLAPGQSLTKAIKVALTPGTTASGKFVIALADADDTMPDADDTDNIAVFGPLP